MSFDIVYFDCHHQRCRLRHHHHHHLFIYLFNVGAFNGTINHTYLHQQLVAYGNKSKDIFTKNCLHVKNMHCRFGIIFISSQAVSVFFEGSKGG